MNNELTVIGKVFSLEAANASTSTASLLDRFPTFFADVVNATQAAVSKTVSALSSSHDPELAAFMRKIQTGAVGYNALANLQVYVPDGMEGTWLSFLEKMIPEIDLACRVPTDVLAPYARWVAGYVASPDRLKSLNPDSTPFKADLFESSPFAASHLLDLHDNAGRPQHVRYADAIERNADWPVLISKTAEQQQRLSATQPSKVLQQVQEVGAEVNQLIDRIKTDPVGYKTSKVALGHLVKLTLWVASAVEYYAAILYVFNRFEVALQDSRRKVLALAS